MWRRPALTRLAAGGLATLAAAAPASAADFVEHPPGATHDLTVAGAASLTIELGDHTITFTLGGADTWAPPTSTPPDPACSAAGAVLICAREALRAEVGGTGGRDTITITGSGGAGRDVLDVAGGGGADTLSAAGAADARVRLDGQDAGDELTAGAAGAVLIGGGGGDTLTGGAGDDDLLPGAGDDQADGAGGDDRFLAELVADGADRFIGGSGSDAIRYDGRTAGVHLAADDRAASGEPGEGDRIGADVEQLVAGLGGDTLAAGASGSSVLVAGPGDDRVDASAGTAEEVFCGEGVDAVTAGAEDYAEDCEAVTGTPSEPPSPVAGRGPEIRGTAQAGSILTASSGTWRGNPAPSVAYHWLRCDAAGTACSVIAGASDPAYTPTRADVGSTLRVRVTAANAFAAAVVESGPTGAVAAASGTTGALTPLPDLDDDASELAPEPLRLLVGLDGAVGREPLVVDPAEDLVVDCDAGGELLDSCRATVQARRRGRWVTIGSGTGEDDAAVTLTATGRRLLRTTLAAVAIRIDATARAGDRTVTDRATATIAAQAASVTVSGLSRWSSRLTRGARRALARVVTQLNAVPAQTIAVTAVSRRSEPAGRRRARARTAAAYLTARGVQATVTTAVRSVRSGAPRVVIAVRRRG